MTRRKRRATAWPLLWAEMMMASGETIARRTAMMMSGTCTPAEYRRMAGEKLRAVQRSTLALASGRRGNAALAAVLRPWHGPAIANAKRLRRK